MSYVQSADVGLAVCIRVGAAQSGLHPSFLGFVFCSAQFFFKPAGNTQSRGEKEGGKIFYF